MKVNISQPFKTYPNRLLTNKDAYKLDGKIYENTVIICNKKQDACKLNLEYHVVFENSLYQISDKISKDKGYLGLQTWMAIEGGRGGFITLGFDGGYRYRVTQNSYIDLGAYIGAGGGNGGYFLSGGGLMLRPHLSFLWRGFYGLDLGAGISYVVFPSDGTIESVQPFIQLSLPYEHRRKKTDIGTFKLSGFKSMGMVVRHVFVDDGVKNESDNKQLDFSLIGIDLSYCF